MSFCVFSVHTARAQPRCLKKWEVCVIVSWQPLSSSSRKLATGQAFAFFPLVRFLRCEAMIVANCLVVVGAVAVKGPGFVSLFFCWVIDLRAHNSRRTRSWMTLQGFLVSVIVRLNIKSTLWSHSHGRWKTWTRQKKRNKKQKINNF